MTPTSAEMHQYIADMKVLIAAQEHRIAHQNQAIAQVRRDVEALIHAHMTCQERPAYETPLTTIHRVWRHVSDEDRLRFLTEMLTPHERRALACGLDDEED